MLRLQENDHEALQQLLHAYSGPVLRYVERLLGSADHAEDVCQEAYLDLWKNRHGWRGGLAPTSSGPHVVQP